MIHAPSLRASLPSSPSRASRAALTALSALALTGALAGCTASEAATPPPGSDVQAAPAAAKGPKVDSETYTIEMKPTGKYKAGQEGSVEVTLVPKAPYHINDKYPIKFKPTEPAPDGIKYPKAVLKKEDGTVDDKKALFKVPFVVSKAGPTKVSGTLYMSVCSEANCIMDKQELEASVDVE
ncbi:hypothetical protein [Chondromyces apiculatus]|uniref:Thiol:disulfide interchange protein DsbD N-terminal domain-containing protein n=1 Tax=Chondromyces apiculatus DSM 436 TaxID=1192034 RepID=A0A017TG68_9BACT|nr:hypothetical protein [Chondromyces apiculatus]EYF07917.1 Hypothetical protein CAP_6939 [Chondromyces apiculatus DSM 436]